MIAECFARSSGCTGHSVDSGEDYIGHLKKDGSNRRPLPHRKVPRMEVTEALQGLSGMWPMGKTGRYASDRQAGVTATFKTPFPMPFLRRSTRKVKSSNEGLEMRR